MSSEREAATALFKAIMEILKNGNDVQIQRKGEGFIVLEVKRTIRIRQENKI